MNHNSKTIYRLLGCVLCMFLLGLSPLQAQFTLNAPAGGSAYKWYTGGVQVPLATAATYTPTAPGVYYATYTANACNQQTSLFILVDFCTDGSTVNLNLNLPGGDETVTWSNGGSGPSKAVVSTDVLTTYTATIISDGGACTAIRSFSVVNFNNDCDGDGVTNDKELAATGPNDPATDPKDPCKYNPTEQVIASVSAAWSAADCDNDGLTNGEEATGVDNPTTPANPGGILTNPLNPDTDGDGVTDGAERTSTGPTDPLTSAADPCKYNATEQVIANATAAWLAADCDGDGNPNSNDPNPLVAVAVNDAFNAALASPTSHNILANDDFLANAGNTIVRIGGTAGGTVALNPVTGNITYTPLVSEAGSNVTVIYRVCKGTVCAQATVTITVAAKVALLPKVFLQGSLFAVNGAGTFMRDDLRVKNLIPLTSPYPAMGLTEVTPTAATTSAVLSVTGQNAIVDWVYIELRDAVDPTIVRDTRSALVQRDGDIVEVDGITQLTFNQVLSGSYYVAVKHRNHLGVMSKDPIPLSAVATVVDFRLPSTPTYNLNATNITNQAQVVVDQGVALWAGNALYDNAVIYQGTQNDINPIYQLVINATGNFFVTPFFKLKTYNNGDINMNGETIFQGTQNDVEFIYQNIIKNHPGNILKQNFFIIKEQLP